MLSVVEASTEFKVLPINDTDNWQVADFEISLLTSDELIINVEAEGALCIWVFKIEVY